VSTSKLDEWGDRCRACGCFLAEVDASTESGYDYVLACNNKRCPSKRRNTKEKTGTSPNGSSMPAVNEPASTH